MDQRKYLVYAVVLLLVIGAACFAYQKFFQVKGLREPSTIIDYVDKADSLPKAQSNGKMLYMSKCASCHLVFREATGPALFGVKDRGPWADSIKLYKYIKQPRSFDKNKYIDSLRQSYNSNHMAFPDLPDYEITLILQYIYKQKQNTIDIIVD